MSILDDFINSLFGKSAKQSSVPHVPRKAKTLDLVEATIAQFAHSSVSDTDSDGDDNDDYGWCEGYSDRCTIHRGNVVFTRYDHDYDMYRMSVSVDGECVCLYHVYDEHKGRSVVEDGGSVEWLVRSTKLDGIIVDAIIELATRARARELERTISVAQYEQDQADKRKAFADRYDGVVVGRP